MFDSKNYSIKKPLTGLFAVASIFSMISCNSEPEKDSVAIGQSTQQADAIQVIDTKTVRKADPDPVITPSPEAAPPSAKEVNAQFHKVLSFKNISFTVTARGKGSLQQLTIQPSGLSLDNRPIVLDAEPVVGAEVGDLNSDGYPELLVFTQSAGSGSYGKVLAYSANKGKSISGVNFPSTSENPRIKNGYMGHDRFKVVNKQLVQTFPIFEKGDGNSTRTGMKRVVTYRLKNGEASRFFEVDKVTEATQE